MTVKDAMTTTVVTVSLDDTLRDAARRMTERGVGAAVVDGGGGRRQGIITERDLLLALGRGENVDEEVVAGHLSPVLIYANVGWPLERAAEKMAEAGARHVIVTDKAGAAIGILSMRDIVRCWIASGAAAVGSATA